MTDRSPDLQAVYDQLSRLTDQNARLEAEVARLSEERIPLVDRSSRRRDRRLTLAYVLMTAVVVGLASVGSASALDGSNTVFTDDIVTGGVTTEDIKDASVTPVDVRDGSLASIDVRDSSLSGIDVADGSIGAGDLADGSVTTVDIANWSINGEDLNLFDDNQCVGETVQGTAIVNADPAVPSTYTTDWVGWDHTCAGGWGAMVKRFKQGMYGVSFGEDHPSKLALVTPVANAGTTDVPAYASVGNLGLGAFVVAMHDRDGNLVDADFQILTY